MSRLEQLIAELCPDGVIFETLGDVVNIHDNQRKPVTKKDRINGKYPYYGANGIQDYVNDFIFDGTFLLMGEDGSVINKDNTPVLTWATGKIWVNNHAHIMSEKSDKALLRFLWFYLSTVDVSSMVRGTPPKINQQQLRSIVIPLPPLPVQRKIVRILDTFTELTAELTTELTARKTQYEYYRDELLTFGDEVPVENFGNVCSFVRGPFGGNLRKECFVTDGYAVYEQQHAIYGDFTFRYFVTEQKYSEMKRFRVKPGDLIMSCSGTMGKISIIPENAKDGIIRECL